MDNTFKYIASGAGIASVATLGFRLITNQQSQNTTLLFVCVSLFALLTMLVGNLYISTKKITTPKTPERATLK